MGSDMTCRAMEDISLRNDAGHDIAFKGRLFSECSWYDDETGVLTRQKLYVTEDNEQIYYIVSAAGPRAAAGPTACVWKVTGASSTTVSATCPCNSTCCCWPCAACAGLMPHLPTRPCWPAWKRR